MRNRAMQLQALLLETMRQRIEEQEAARPTMDQGGVLVSHDAWDAIQRNLAELQAFKAGALPFLQTFAETGYSEWDGYEYECPHCTLGHRAFNRESEWLSDLELHDEDCLWRMAVEFLAANAPKETVE